MKKLLYLFILISTMVVLTFVGCGDKEENETFNNPDQPSMGLSLRIYDKITNERLANVALTEESVTLSVGIEYIFDFYCIHSGTGMRDFEDSGLKFSYDNYYFSLNKCDADNEIDHKYYFKALTVTEGTELIVELGDYSRTLIFTLI